MTDVIRFEHYVVQVGVSYLGEGPAGLRLVGGWENATRFKRKADANKAMLHYFKTTGLDIQPWKVFTEPR